MTREQINKILDNLVKEGLTRGEAYVKVRRLMLIRLEHAPDNLQGRFIDDLDLLHRIFIGR